MIRGRDLTNQVGRLPLYRGLDPADLLEVTAGLRPVRFADGDVLMQQGDPPDGAYCLLSGKAKVLTRLPGGGETLIAEIGPGSLLGELALIRPERRSATVLADGPVEAMFADRRYFLGSLAQLRPSAIKVSRNIAKILAHRLLQRHLSIRDHIEAHSKNSYFTAVPAAPENNTIGVPAFDARSFLPILPTLREFEAPELERLAELTEIQHTPAGTFLNPEATKSPRGYIVVRGAVVSCLPHGDRVHQLNVLGPGQFCAIGPLLDAGLSPVRHFVRHSATLLAFSANRFAEMIGGVDRFSFSLLSAVNEHQAMMILRAGNHLTRLVGLSRLYRQMKTESPVIFV